MAEKENKATMTQKLITIQQRLKVAKERDNKFGEFKFRSCEDILKAVKPMLSELGLALLLKDSIEMVGTRFYMRSKAILTDGKETIEADGWAREPEHKTKSDDAQVTGMASSYARKYALCGLFIIDNTDNKDFDMLDNTQNDPLADQIRAAGSIEELTELWKNNPQCGTDAKYKELFSQRKHELQDEH